MATRNIIDLSQPITPASPAPCDPPVEFRTVARHGPDSPYQMMWFGMTDHTGTHIDAPLHFVPGGKPIDEADLSALYSMPGVFLDFTAASPFHKIDADDVERELKQYGSIPEEAFIMLHTGTGWYSNTREYFNSRSSLLPLRNASSGSVRWLWASTAPPWTTAGGKAAPSTAPSCPMVCISSKASCVPNFWQENDFTVRPCP